MEQPLNQPNAIPPSSHDKLKQFLLKVIMIGFIAYALGMTALLLSATPSEGIGKLTMTAHGLGLFSFTAYASTRARSHKAMEVVGLIGTFVSGVAMLLAFALIWIFIDQENVTGFAKATGTAAVVALCLAHSINLAFLKPGHPLTVPFKYITVAGTILFGASFCYVILNPDVFGGFFMGTPVAVKLLGISLAVTFSGTICSVICAKYLKPPPPARAEQSDEVVATE